MNKIKRILFYLPLRIDKIALTIAYATYAQNQGRILFVHSQF